VVCGIAGLILKSGSSNIGQDIINMLDKMVHRGEDSTGFAVYENNEVCEVRVNCSTEKDVETLRHIIEQFGSIDDERVLRSRVGSYLVWADVTVKYEELPVLYRAIDKVPTLCVHSAGKWLRILKDMGSAKNLMDHYTDVEFDGYQGIGHVRLATESVENINFAHPFSTYYLPELAIAHNGQLTNYFNLRRKMERKGVTFKTFNDSEIIAHYIGYHMVEDGWSFEETLEKSIDEFDGVFTYTASLPDKIGVVRDRLGIKPLYIHENDQYVLFGTEQVCFSPLIHESYSEEMDPGSVIVWSR